jgi:hypothetical protein
MSNNLAQEAFDLPNKVRTQARGASFVEPGGCDKFAFRPEGERRESPKRGTRFFQHLPSGDAGKFAAFKLG